MQEEKLISNYSDTINTKQYYFDRNPKFFSLIQEWYRTNRIPLYNVKTEDINGIYDELKYWEISPSKIFDELKTVSSVFDGDDKVKVGKFIDGFIKTRLLQNNREKRYYDLFLQDYPDECVYVNCIFNKVLYIPKDIKSHSLVALDEKFVKIIKRYEQGYYIPLMDCKYTFNDEVVKVINSECKSILNLHPILNEIYCFCYHHCVDEIRNISHIITDKNVVDIIANYIYINDGIDLSSSLESHYISFALAMYKNLISGAELFDNDNNLHACAMRRQYAIDYLARCGIIANWMQRHINCNSDIISHYPFNADFELFPRPYYKCPICRIQRWGTMKLDTNAEHRSKDFNVWYLHFEW